MGSGDLWFFDRVARLYDLVMPAADRAVLQQAVERSGSPVRTVIDVGGGTGRASRAIEAARRVVVDASTGMLARVPEPIAPVAGSATALPVRSGAADAVVIVDALHHLPQPARVLAEAYDALRPGGALVVGEFDPGTLRGLAVVLGERVMGFDSTFWGPDDLTALLADAGFDPTVLERGFTYTVVGRKPAEP